ncbi:Cytochrome c oxidase assembly protein CtaG [Roseovarius litorisediminis]|uniref:Cytochrome c oxidase assembly protein CtaG n=1 Tax=Roseovarius litorisediminis TaxID=1312363 RepID=A0A1Y5SHT1_9RHOB|nr:cytochrome c oxidase assembly protein [Roseovarius litorisediminis]SLN40804.1 Cytochrome c oxidase assembly protein CtaG [Roseovarius litorisediminis]
MEMDAKTKTVTRLVGVVLLMGGLAWASVPFYDWFCRVTGFGGTTGVASKASGEVLDKTITIRFDASKENGMPWKFKPMVREMELRIGETGLAFYEAYNPTDRPVAGQAAYNVTPYEAGGFFTKIDCFCFTEQVLQPGERVQMPVTFFVDPEIVTDRDAKYTHTITLSYTFYEIDLPQEQAALAPEQETDKKLN